MPNPDLPMLRRTSINAIKAQPYLKHAICSNSAVLSHAELDFETLQKFKQEVDLQRKLSLHPNIVRFLGACCPALQRNPQPADLQVRVCHIMCHVLSDSFRGLQGEVLQPILGTCPL